MLLLHRVNNDRNVNLVNSPWASFAFVILIKANKQGNASVRLLLSFSLVRIEKSEGMYLYSYMFRLLVATVIQVVRLVFSSLSISFLIFS